MLWEAALRGNIEKCQEAIRNGADVNWQNKAFVSTNKTSFDLHLSIYPFSRLHRFNDGTELDFHLLEMFPLDICDECDIPAGSALLTLQETWSPPLFGTCLCSNCGNQIPQTYHAFTRLFTLNTPWYFFFRFCSQFHQISIRFLIGSSV